MLKIGICDDELLVQKQIGNIISGYLSNKKYTYELFLFLSILYME